MMLLLWLGSPQLAAFRLLRGDDDNNNNIEIGGGWVGWKRREWVNGRVGMWVNGEASKMDKLWVMLGGGGCVDKSLAVRSLAKRGLNGFPQIS